MFVALCCKGILSLFKCFLGTVIKNLVHYFFLTQATFDTIHGCLIFAGQYREVNNTQSRTYFSILIILLV